MSYYVRIGCLSISPAPSRHASVLEMNQFVIPALNAFEVLDGPINDLDFAEDRQKLWLSLETRNESAETEFED